MDDGDAPAYVRIPQVQDLVRICRSLNEADVTAETLEIDGVSIPIADKRMLIRTKDTVRPSDRADREFLEARHRFFR